MLAEDPLVSGLIYMLKFSCNSMLLGKLAKTLVMTMAILELQAVFEMFDVL